MAILIIKDDNDNKHTYSLISGVTNISSGSLILDFKTTDGHFKYHIHSDDRESNINDIDNFIQQKLNNALNNINPFTLSEYLARDYIYIGDIDVEEMKQFTAQKL